MRPTAASHEVLKMRFLEANELFQRGKMSCDDVARCLGVSPSTFFRWRKRYDADGEEGLADGRVGKFSARRVPVDEVLRLLSLYETHYPDYTVKHFHEKLEKHGFRLSYTCVKNKLQEARVVKKAQKRGRHRRKRPRKPLPGMMLHQDGSTHQWTPGAWWDLILTMDDATSEIYSLFFCEQEGTMSTFQGLSETIRTMGLPCSLYVDRGSHYFVTEKAGGKVSRTQTTQVGRAMRQLGIEMIAAYSPEARGRCERMFGTLQKRLPQELRLHGITDMQSANRFLREVFLADHNARFAKPAEREGSAFTPLMGYPLNDVFCIQEERLAAKDNTVRYKRRILQILEDTGRYSYAGCQVRVHEYPDGQLAVFHGPRRLSIAPAAKAQEDKEGDYTDAFSALDPNSVWQNEGEAFPSPSPDSGCSFGAQVARRRSPILRTAPSISAG